jgi:hypothetical protein
MNIGRVISLVAWAAIIAAWASTLAASPGLKPNVTPVPPTLGAPQTIALHQPEREHLEMTPADLWAIVNLKFPQLPPIEFDHIPDQVVTIKDVPSEAELRKVCRWPPSDGTTTIVGCADIRDPRVCRIYLGPRPEWSGLTRNLVIRHELGHCNSWPPDHPGMR